jgi:hypothetical protein
MDECWQDGGINPPNVPVSFLIIAQDEIGFF